MFLILQFDGLQFHEEFIIFTITSLGDYIILLNTSIIESKIANSLVPFALKLLFLMRVLIRLVNNLFEISQGVGQSIVLIAKCKPVLSYAKFTYSTNF